MNEKILAIAIEIMKSLATEQPNFTAQEAASISIEWANALMNEWKKT